MENTFITACGSEEACGSLSSSESVNIEASSSAVRFCCAFGNMFVVACVCVCVCVCVSECVCVCVCKCE
jgi:hypothetical protein